VPDQLSLTVSYDVLRFALAYFRLPPPRIDRDMSCDCVVL